MSVPAKKKLQPKPTARPPAKSVGKEEKKAGTPAKAAEKGKEKEKEKEKENAAADDDLASVDPAAIAEAAKDEKELADSMKAASGDWQSRYTPEQLAKMSEWDLHMLCPAFFGHYTIDIKKPENGHIWLKAEKPTFGTGGKQYNLYIKNPQTGIVSKAKNVCIVTPPLMVEGYPTMWPLGNATNKFGPMKTGGTGKLADAKYQADFGLGGYGNETDVQGRSILSVKFAEWCTKLDWMVFTQLVVKQHVQWTDWDDEKRTNQAALLEEFNKLSIKEGYRHIWTAKWTGSGPSVSNAIMRLKAPVWERRPYFSRANPDTRDPILLAAMGVMQHPTQKEPFFYSDMVQRDKDGFLIPLDSRSMAARDVCVNVLVLNGVSTIELNSTVRVAFKWQEVWTIKQRVMIEEKDRSLLLPPIPGDVYIPGARSLTFDGEEGKAVLGYIESQEAASQAAMSKMDESERRKIKEAQARLLQPRAVTYEQARAKPSAAAAALKFDGADSKMSSLVSGLEKEEKKAAAAAAPSVSPRKRVRSEAAASEESSAPAAGGVAAFQATVAAMEALPEVDM